MFSASHKSGKKKSKLYVDDVFSTYTYTGNGSTQTITNGIDLSTYGGLVWTKMRSSLGNNYAFHQLVDTLRGGSQGLSSNNTNGQTGIVAGSISVFSSDGYTMSSSGGGINLSGYNYVSWTFKKQAKFFDVVTWSGNSTNRTIAHSLGVAPGMAIIKRTDATGGTWMVWHRSGTQNNTYAIALNATGGYSDYGVNCWGSLTFDSSVFSVGTINEVNATGGTYVAYLFAHDTASDGLIQCGSFTVNGADQNINLGWEPQYLLMKNITSASDWQVMDTMRGWTSLAGTDNYASLQPNVSSAESALTSYLAPTATGFRISGSFGISGTIVYLAIRRPNKPPTSGTQVFNAVARNGSGSNVVSTSGFGYADAVFVANRNNGGGTPVGKAMTATRLTGIGAMRTSDTAAEYTASSAFFQTNPWDNMTGVGISTGNAATNDASSTFVDWFFRRAPGFMDVVCHTGTGAAQTISHNLGSVPELMIVKVRSAINYWYVYHKDLGNTSCLFLDQTVSTQTGFSGWNSYTPTSTLFSVGAALSTNTYTYVSYLFATLPGISKVGSYTGNGTSQTINCGFSAGARFILVKRTDTTGNWYAYDSARGIVAGNDPYLLWNYTFKEDDHNGDGTTTATDSVDPDNSGFVVNQETTLNLNVNTATYIYLAIA